MWSEIIYIENRSFLSFEYLFLHWISISSALPRLANRTWPPLLLKEFCSLGLWDANDDCHWRDRTNFGAGICWEQKSSGLLFSSAGSREGGVVVTSFLPAFLKHGVSSFPFSLLRCYSAKCCLWVLPSPWVGFANLRDVPGATSWPPCHAQPPSLTPGIQCNLSKPQVSILCLRSCLTT